MSQTCKLLSPVRYMQLTPLTELDEVEAFTGETVSREHPVGGQHYIEDGDERVDINIGDVIVQIAGDWEVFTKEAFEEHFETI